MTVDDAILNMNPGSLIALGVVLGLIMFGIALDTRIEDFRAVLKAPRAFAIALVAQLVLLPAATFGLTLLLQVGPSIALGMILVACCPPGNISQMLTYRSRGNVALSVSMTAVTNVVYIVMLPVNLSLWGGWHPAASAILESVSLNGRQMLLEIVLIIGLPFTVGLATTNRWPEFAKKVHPTVKWVSLFALLAFIIATLAGNFQFFIGYVGVVLLAVFLHDAVALGLGYASARLGGLALYEAKAVTFEVGIRNAGLGLGLIFAFFGGLGGMAIVAGWWGIWDIIAGLALATWWGRRRARSVGDGSRSDSGVPANDTEAVA